MFGHHRKEIKGRIVKVSYSGSVLEGRAQKQIKAYGECAVLIDTMKQLTPSALEFYGYMTRTCVIGVGYRIAEILPKKTTNYTGIWKILDELAQHGLIDYERGGPIYLRDWKNKVMKGRAYWLIPECKLVLVDEDYNLIKDGEIYLSGDIIKGIMEKAEVNQSESS